MSTTILYLRPDSQNGDTAESQGSRTRTLEEQCAILKTVFRKICQEPLLQDVPVALQGMKIVISLTFGIQRDIRNLLDEKYKELTMKDPVMEELKKLGKPTHYIVCSIQGLKTQKQILEETEAVRLALLPRLERAKVSVSRQKLERNMIPVSGTELTMRRICSSYLRKGKISIQQNFDLHTTDSMENGQDASPSRPPASLPERELE